MKTSFAIKIFLAFLFVSVLHTSCFNDLDTIPLDEDVITSARVYDQPDSYIRVLAKLYAGLSVSGQQGPSGQPDIAGIDEGFGQYLRGYWYHQQLSTDEAVIGWNDATIKDFHEQDWDANDGFINAFYSRIFYQISLCNEFLRETTDEKLDGRSVEGTLRSEIATYRAEARFLRALSYFHALDLFRNVPFVTEEDAVGSFFPEQISPTDLFNFLVEELQEVETQLPAPKQNEYGRADAAAAWMLLAKLFLNAEVYTGQGRYNECVEYCNKVLSAGYSLEPEYAHLFMADNENNNEVIFPITFDGVNTRTWGGTTFIVHAAVGGDMRPSDYGIDGGWGGTRTTSALVNKYTAGSGFVPFIEPNPGQEYSVIYVPGGYQGWDPSLTSTTMASPSGDGTYEGYFYFSDASTELKFTDGPGWDINYGDNSADGTLEQNGGNIVVPEAGVYKINVNLNDLTYTIAKVQFGVIGSATENGWDSDIDMSYNPNTGAWEVTLDLTAGEIKFRANDDWALNYGDNNGDALLQENGANIQIPDAGTYLIQMFLDKPDYTYALKRPSVDGRGMFFTAGQNLEISDISLFTEGYAVTKFTNLTSTGVAGSDLTFMDTDFPMFRLADAHLMYAEAVLRGGNGDRGTALNLINQLRDRAYGNETGRISDSDLTLNFILDERARELYWECHRRTDLVRFGQFTNGSYTWPWKGGVAEGTTVSPDFNVYPIPANDIGANPNLTQNKGY